MKKVFMSAAVVAMMVAAVACECNNSKKECCEAPAEEAVEAVAEENAEAPAEEAPVAEAEAPAAE